MMKRILLLAASCLTLAACDNPGDVAAVGADATCNIVDYHSGIFYFYCTMSSFANALSQFIEQHPELRVIAMAGDGNATYGIDRGYFVVTEPR